MFTAFQQALELIFSGSETLTQIILVTLRMSVASSLISLALGTVWGVFLAMARFPGRNVLVVVNRTLMGLPPVVCGLICYLAFSGVGPLRHLHLLYTVEGMTIAQIILITPVVAGSIEAFAKGIVDPVVETARGIGASRARVLWLVISECRYQICATFLLAFGRAIAEVGAVSMVGGAIAFKTNVMTTAIMMYTNMGDFTIAIALGIILLGMFLILNVGMHFVSAKVTR